MGESLAIAFVTIRIALRGLSSARAYANQIFVAVLALSIAGIAGCSAENPAPELAAPPPAPHLQSANPAISPHVEVASWYGPGFQGHPTSTGERYNEYGLTAASKTLPLGTRIRVTNPANGKSVEVRINDRGPYVRGRSLDLSKGAAQRLGLTAKGVAPVVVASPDATPTPVRYSPTRRVAVADYESSHSQRLAERLPPPHNAERSWWPSAHRHSKYRVARAHYSHSYSRHHPRKVWNPVGAWIASSIPTF